uniref:uncharacterized protein LOC122587507 n=1 Tax=Erigeron canadensis TaxID=72917 RepID=UPI001CB9666B|nr:uncharacterized protein LOC122587507 [Erigeron canadensis]
MRNVQASKQVVTDMSMLRFHVANPKNVSHLFLTLLEDYGVEWWQLEVEQKQQRRSNGGDGRVKALQPSLFRKRRFMKKNYIVYKGYEPPKWFKGCFHSLNKVSVSLSLCETYKKYDEEDARETINMLQQLQSAKFLTLNFDIVECLSAYPDLVSHLPSPFSNLICLKIDPYMRSDAYKVNVSTEAINFLLENSPRAMFIMDIPEEPPTKAMIAKRAREMKRAKLIADIENCITGLQALLEQGNSVLVERKKAQEKTKVAIQNIILELTVWANKKIMGSEPEKPKEFAESREVASGLMTQFEARLREMQDLGEQNLHGSVDILTKKGRVILLFKNLPKRQRMHITF